MDENSGDAALPTDSTPEPSATAASSGACPLCDQEFDDVAAFRTHLGDAHDLFDDDGAETDFLPPALEPLPALDDDDDDEDVPAAAGAVGAAEVTAALAPASPTRQERRRALPLLGAAAALVGLVVVAVVVTGGGGRDEAATATLPVPETAAPDTTGLGPGPSPSSDAAAATAGTAGVAAGVDAPPTTFVVVTEQPAPPETTVPDTAPPTEPPTVAPPAFVAPSAIDARIDSCTVQGTGQNRTWVARYSWVFNGGANWQPGPGETATGGRYAATFSTPRNQPATITTVVVIDANGQATNVALQPALVVDNSVC